MFRILPYVLALSVSTSLFVGCEDEKREPTLAEYKHDLEKEASTACVDKLAEVHGKDATTKGASIESEPGDKKPGVPWTITVWGTVELNGERQTMKCEYLNGKVKSFKVYKP